MKRTGLDFAAIISTVIVALLLSCAPPIAFSAGSAPSRHPAGGLFPEPACFHEEDNFALQAARNLWPTVREPSVSVSEEVPSLSTIRAHKYLGYGTLILAGLAAATSSSHELHRATSYAATWLAGATCATGFAGYHRLIDFSDGFSVHDTHALLGALGTAALVTTVILAESDGDDGHGGIGAASGAALGISVLAVKIEW